MAATTERRRWRQRWRQRRRRWRRDGSAAMATGRGERGRRRRWRRRHGGGGAGGGEKQPRSPQLELSPAALWALMRAARIALTAAHRARLTSTHRIFARYYVHLGCLTVSKGISRHRRRRALDAIDSAAAALGSTTTAIAAAARTSTGINSVSRLRSSPPGHRRSARVDSATLRPRRPAPLERSGGRAGHPQSFPRCAARGDQLIGRRPSRARGRPGARVGRRRRT